MTFLLNSNNSFLSTNFATLSQDTTYFFFPAPLGSGRWVKCFGVIIRLISVKPILGLAELGIYFTVHDKLRDKSMDENKKV